MPAITWETDTENAIHAVFFNEPDPVEGELNATRKRPNLTLEESITYLEEHTTSEWREMVKTNFSLGFERSEKQLKKNNLDHTKWSNPLEVQLPYAPSMKIYCRKSTIFSSLVDQVPMATEACFVCSVWLG